MTVTLPRYIVYDSETTITDNNGTAFVPENRVVISGVKTEIIKSISDGIDVIVLAEMEHGALLVGQNITFDLHYIIKEMGTHWIEECINAGLRIWDTQIAEYVLSGQQTRMASLDELATLYGGTIKDSYVSDMFANGIGADKIEKSVLIPYLEADLENTELVFKKQYEQAVLSNKLPLIMYMNHARLMTTLMQYNGLRVDKAGLVTLKMQLERDMQIYRDDIVVELMYEIKRSLPPDAVLNQDEDSLCTDAMLSSYFFGGTAVLDVKVPTGTTYKSGKKAGQVKYKNDTALVTFKTKHLPWLPTKSSKSYTLLHPMDDDVIDVLARSFKLAFKVRELRRCKKIVGTYIDGVLKNTYDTEKGSFVHPDYNHALTATGRLSCARPNLQNVDGEVKQYYVPLDGHQFLLEFDFKQLEVCGLAQLSRDPQLIADICNGVDLHYETGRTVFGWCSPADMDEKTRRGVKGVNFGLIYGGSAKGLAKQTGFDVKVVEKLIAAFYSRYPMVKVWQDDNISAVKKGRTYTSGGMRTEKGYPRGVSSLKSCTGREYVFTEYDAPDWIVETRKEYTSFSPTEIKNYPVQGFATGDVVPITLGVMMQYYCAEDELGVTPVNTVHDSIMFSVAYGQEAQDLYHLVVDKVMPTVVQVLKDSFGIDMLVPLNVDAKIGYNWGNMDKYKP
jgi:DNA polymerase I-like protein with 3'-5' exonuclease and polymerase domains